MCGLGEIRWYGPGVHIGNNVVIGAGSVVTRDIPDWSVAAGNPCRVIRKITEEDRRKLFRNEEIDEEAWKIFYPVSRMKNNTVQKRFPKFR